MFEEEIFVITITYCVEKNGKTNKIYFNQIAWL